MWIYLVFVYAIKPFALGLFTTIGAGTPIALLLWRYSVIEKKRLNKELPYIEGQIAVFKRSNEIGEGLRSRYAEKMRSATNGGPDNSVSDDEMQRILDSYKRSEELIVTTGLEIGKLKERVRYINNYGLWTLVENVLERRYISSPVENNKQQTSL